MIHPINHQGSALLIILDEPNWATRPKLTREVQTGILTRLDAGESRRPEHTLARHTLTLAWDIETADLDNWEDVFAQNLADALVALPVPCDRLLRDDYLAARLFDAAWTLVIPADGAPPSVVATAQLDANPALVPATATLAPLLVGKLKARPKFRGITADGSSVSLTLLEESPARYAIRLPARQAIPDNWPAILEANWAYAVETATIDTIEKKTIGRGRLPATDLTEAPPRQTLVHTLTLGSREEISALLDFHHARASTAQSFLALSPQFPDRPPRRHRFTTTSLEITFVSQEMAEAKIALTEAPGEASALAAAEPVRAHLYTFTLRIPGLAQNQLPVWRYTDWETDITFEGATWLGDTRSLIEHDTITRTADLSDPALKLTLSANLPQNPLSLLASGELEAPLQIEIHACRPDPGASATAPVATTQAREALHTGDIAEVSAEGRTLTATSRALAGRLENKIPRFVFSGVCNHRFCDTGCTLLAAAWRVTGVIAVASAGAAVLTVTPDAPANTVWLTGALARGHLILSLAPEAGLPVGDWQVRQIVAVAGSVNARQITLRSPLRALPAPLALTGRPVTLMAACDGTPDACKARGNYINFGGHPHIGPDNLSLPSYNTSDAIGKKG
ncbi:hypothetical protein OPIT5_29230 [Opitutaceae bacterium TAV5]|nr:hypothetical protein OPIT5_21890 [Opitutaceae bacterium TAV5]AHF94876.1 hypothetical protein OPIT5_29230 [Opitutaceae bacterium TAV5]